MYNPIRTRTSWTRCRAPSRLPKTFHFPKSVKFHQIFCNVRNIWISCSPSPFSDVFSVIPCVLKCLVSSKNKTPYPNPQFSLFPPYLTHICWRSSKTQRQDYLQFHEDIIFHQHVLCPTPIFT